MSRKKLRETRVVSRPSNVMIIDHPENIVDPCFCSYHSYPFCRESPRKLTTVDRLYGAIKETKEVISTAEAWIQARRDLDLVVPARVSKDTRDLGKLIARLEFIFTEAQSIRANLTMAFISCAVSGIIVTTGLALGVGSSVTRVGSFGVLASVLGISTFFGMSKHGATSRHVARALVVIKDIEGRTEGGREVAR
jgi:hypothetical protein